MPVLYLICLFFFLPTAVDCMVLPEIPNGKPIVYATDMSPDFELTTTATYCCIDDYFLVGDEVRTCIDNNDNDADGVFTGQAPRCVRKCCQLQ